MSSVCAQISGVSCDITSFLCIKKRNFANVLDHPMPSSPSKKSNMMRLLSSSIFYWFCFIKILELKKSILLLSWRHDLWVSPHQLSILFQLGRVCHPVHDNLLPIWLALCSSWESSPDLSFHGTLLCRVRSQKHVRKLQWFTLTMKLLFRLFPRIYSMSFSVPTSGLNTWHLDFLTSWVRSLPPKR